MAVAATAPIPQASLADSSPPFRAGGAASSGDWDFSFHDLVSIVNPLQHFPIVSTLYRKFTGDTIKPLERLAGDTLYGGWMGMVSSVANLVFEKATGKDFGDTVLAMIDGGRDSSATAAPLRSASSNSGTGASTPTASITSARTDAALSRRAMVAYRRSIEISPRTADLTRVL